MMGASPRSQLCWRAVPALKSQLCWVPGQGSASFLPPVCCRITDVGVLFQGFAVFLLKTRGVCHSREPREGGGSGLHQQVPLPGGSAAGRALCPPGCFLMPALGTILLCILYLASPSSKHPCLSSSCVSAHHHLSADADVLPGGSTASGGGPNADLDKALLAQHSAQTQGDFIPRDEPSLFLGCGVAPAVTGVTSATVFPNASEVEREE